MIEFWKKFKVRQYFFDATNIFCYHMSHAYYTLDELVNSYKKLRDVLTSSNGTFYRGTSPTNKNRCMGIQMDIVAVRIGDKYGPEYETYLENKLPEHNFIWVHEPYQSICHFAMEQDVGYADGHR